MPNPSLANPLPDLRNRVRELRRLAKTIDRPVRIMEVCGTHTMSAFRSGLRSLLPESVSLLSGPGCPVCVTTADYVDQTLSLARLPGVLIATFGDMLRVPGSQGASLEKERALGADIRVVYSPLDALNLASDLPDQRVVFLGVGFETTVPTVAWTLLQAERQNQANFYVHSAHKTMPAALNALFQQEDVRIDGLLCPGHVSVIIGADAYQPLCRDHRIPCVVAGFEPLDMVQALEMVVQQISEQRAVVENQYLRSVQAQGNTNALQVMHEVFEPDDAVWRGLGTIPQSGLKLNSRFSRFDARPLLPTDNQSSSGENPDCRCGDILRGRCLPPGCSLYRSVCTPENPVGACMVSSEGTCAAYYKYNP